MKRSWPVDAEDFMGGIVAAGLILAMGGLGFVMVGLAIRVVVFDPELAKTVLGISIVPSAVGCLLFTLGLGLMNGRLLVEAATTAVKERLAARESSSSTQPLFTLPREDAREYVLAGDSTWHDSITWSKRPTMDDGTSGRVVGWVPQIPRRGDIVLAESATKPGSWGQWVVQEVYPAGNPADMFFADVKGVIGFTEGVSGERACERIETGGFF